MTAELRIHTKVALPWTLCLLLSATWKPVTDNLFFIVEQAMNPDWNNETAEFVRTQALVDLDEPLGHDLLREASVNRKANPRSALVLAVAAAEVGFKQFFSQAFPDRAPSPELPSPPLVEMFDAFPWSELNVTINEKVPAIPDFITEELKKAVNLRKGFAIGFHSSGVDNPLLSRWASRSKVGTQSHQARRPETFNAVKRPTELSREANRVWSALGGVGSPAARRSVRKMRLCMSSRTSLTAFFLTESFPEATASS